MRKLFALPILFLAATCLGQNVTFRNLAPAQFGSNTYVMYIRSGVVITNPVFYGTMAGDGGGLTNLPTGVGLPGTNTVIAYGDAQRTNYIVIGSSGTTNFGPFYTTLVVADNLEFTTLTWKTNAASTSTIDLSDSYAALSTNNNLSIAGLAGINGTNFQSAARFITNSSAAAITVAMGAGYQNMNASEGSTLFCTNLGHLLVFYYPGLGGTNFYWRSR